MKTYELQWSKTSTPINYTELQALRSFDNFSDSFSGSQIMKRLDVVTFEEILNDLENGINVNLK